MMDDEEEVATQNRTSNRSNFGQQPTSVPSSDNDDDNSALVGGLIAFSEMTTTGDTMRVEKRFHARNHPDKCDAVGNRDEERDIFDVAIYEDKKAPPAPLPAPTAADGNRWHAVSDLHQTTSSPQAAGTSGSAPMAFSSSLDRAESIQSSTDAGVGSSRPNPLTGKRDGTNHSRKRGEVTSIIDMMQVDDDGLEAQKPPPLVRPTQVTAPPAARDDKQSSENDGGGGDAFANPSSGWVPSYVPFLSRPLSMIIAFDPRQRIKTPVSQEEREGDTQVSIVVTAPLVDDACENGSPESDAKANSKSNDVMSCAANSSMSTDPSSDNSSNEFATRIVLWPCNRFFLCYRDVELEEEFCVFLHRHRFRTVILAPIAVLFFVLEGVRLFPTFGGEGERWAAESSAHTQHGSAIALYSLAFVGMLTLLIGTMILYVAVQRHDAQLAVMTRPELRRNAERQDALTSVCSWFGMLICGFYVVVEDACPWMSSFRSSSYVCKDSPGYSVAAYILCTGVVTLMWPQRFCYALLLYTTSMSAFALLHMVLSQPSDNEATFLKEEAAEGWSHHHWSRVVGARIAPIAIFTVWMIALHWFRERTARRDFQQACELEEITRKVKVSREAVVRQITATIPPRVARRLLGSNALITDFSPEAVVLAFGIPSYRSLALTMSCAELVGLLNRVFCELDNVTAGVHCLTKMQTLGDLYLCVGGIYNNPRCKYNKVGMELGYVPAYLIVPQIRKVAVNMQFATCTLTRSVVALHVGPATGTVLGSTFAYVVVGEGVTDCIALLRSCEATSHCVKCTPAFDLALQSTDEGSENRGVPLFASAQQHSVDDAGVIKGSEVDDNSLEDDDELLLQGVLLFSEQRPTATSDFSTKELRTAYFNNSFGKAPLSITTDAAGCTTHHAEWTQDGPSSPQANVVDPPPARAIDRLHPNLTMKRSKLVFTEFEDDLVEAEYREYLVTGASRILTTTTTTREPVRDTKDTNKDTGMTPNSIMMSAGPNTLVTFDDNQSNRAFGNSLINGDGACLEANCCRWGLSREWVLHGGCIAVTVMNIVSLAILGDLALISRAASVESNAHGQQTAAEGLAVSVGIWFATTAFVCVALVSKREVVSTAALTIFVIGMNVGFWVLPRTNYLSHVVVPQSALLLVVANSRTAKSVGVVLDAAKDITVGVVPFAALQVYNFVASYENEGHYDGDDGDNVQGAIDNANDLISAILQVAILLGLVTMTGLAFVFRLLGDLHRRHSFATSAALTSETLRLTMQLNTMQAYIESVIPSFATKRFKTFLEVNSTRLVMSSAGGGMARNAAAYYVDPWAGTWFATAVDDVPLLVLRFPPMSTATEGRDTPSTQVLHRQHSPVVGLSSGSHPPFHPHRERKASVGVPSRDRPAGGSLIFLSSTNSGNHSLTNSGAPQHVNPHLEYVHALSQAHRRLEVVIQAFNREGWAGLYRNTFLAPVIGGGGGSASLKGYSHTQQLTSSGANNTSLSFTAASSQCSTANDRNVQRSASEWENSLANTKFHSKARKSSFSSLGGAVGVTLAPSVYKIKSVGDLVILIGSEKDDEAVRAVRLLECAAAITRAFEGERDGPKIVLNSGLAVGAVIGADRLTFELFGEVVSTSLELLNAMPARGMIATQRFVTIITQHQEDTLRTPTVAKSTSTPLPHHIGTDHSTVADERVSNPLIGSSSAVLHSPAPAMSAGSVTANLVGTDATSGVPFPVKGWGPACPWRIRGGKTVLVAAPLVL